MKCQTSEVELETLVNRIKNGDMDLQPDFQRGEIWPVQKKKKLIDSILRGWKIPPIHVVLNSKEIDEVLDGQQRLVAIRDFYNNIINIDGNVEPLDELIKELDGKYYNELPQEWQRKFLKYSLTVVRLTEYKPEEPAELFYRLNQPSTLTSAEQRNAYVGITRDQVKKLSDLFISLGGKKELIGFSNSRLAYDEIISKFCYTVEIKTLKRKITSTDISELYRKNIKFSDYSITIVEDTVRKFLFCIKQINNYKFSFNKATLFSWLIFVRQNLDIDENQLSQVILNFEFCRSYVKGKSTKTDYYKYLYQYYELQKQLPFFEVMLNTFNQRSSMGSTDALSIIFRDIIIGIFRDALLHNHTTLLMSALELFDEHKNMNIVLDEIARTFDWGGNF